jgi:hypothetical protein
VPCIEMQVSNKLEQVIPSSTYGRRKLVRVLASIRSAPLALQVLRSKLAGVHTSEVHYQLAGTSISHTVLSVCRLCTQFVTKVASINRPPPYQHALKGVERFDSTFLAQVRRVLLTCSSKAPQHSRLSPEHFRQCSESLQAVLRDFLFIPPGVIQRLGLASAFGEVSALLGVSASPLHEGHEGAGASHGPGGLEEEVPPELQGSMDEVITESPC